MSEILCPRCGGAVPKEAPQGLCPSCLLAAVSTPTETGREAREPAPPVQTVSAAFPHLEVIELIGQGGMGFVYKARQPKLDRFVALKILPNQLAVDPAFAERFTREGRLLARLNHPNIVTIHDFGQANGFFYLLMEFVDGVNLRQAMQAGRFTAAQALAIVPKICEALQFAHNEGVLHRDIKPENILLDAKGRVKIADFGIAKLIGEQKDDAPLTQTQSAIGTPSYMAPEQLEKPSEVDHRADIYSLGVVFYEMLTGELPLGKFAPPSEKCASDPRLDDVVLRALAKEPNKRYQSAGEVKTQVESITQPIHQSVVPPQTVLGTYSPQDPRQKSESDRPSKIFVFITLGVLGAIVGTFLLIIAIGIGVYFSLGHRVVPGKQLTEVPMGQTNASTELWLPILAPGEKPDVDKIRHEASALMHEGRYEESLQRHIWYHNHAHEFGEGQKGVRLSFALSDWAELGRRYQKARHALIEIKDAKTKTLLNGNGNFALFMDVHSINHYLGTPIESYNTFRRLGAKDPSLARQAYPVIEPLLVEMGQFALCYTYIKNYEEWFESIREGWARDKQMFPDMSKHYIERVQRLITILVGIGAKAEAEQIQSEAIKILGNDPRLSSAIREAEQKANPGKVIMPINN